MCFTAARTDTSQDRDCTMYYRVFEAWDEPRSYLQGMGYYMVATIHNQHLMPQGFNPTTMPGEDCVLPPRSSLLCGQPCYT